MATDIKKNEKLMLVTEQSNNLSTHVTLAPDCIS